MELPPHVCLTIEHNPHKSYYLDVRGYAASIDEMDHTELAACEAADEIWEIQWYPTSPIGSYRVWAATLDRALALANACERNRR